MVEKNSNSKRFSRLSAPKPSSIRLSNASNRASKLVLIDSISAASTSIRPPRRASTSLRSPLQVTRATQICGESLGLEHDVGAGEEGLDLDDVFGGFESTVPRTPLIRPVLAGFSRRSRTCAVQKVFRGRVPPASSWWDVLTCTALGAPGSVAHECPIQELMPPSLKQIRQPGFGQDLGDPKGSRAASAINHTDGLRVERPDSKEQRCCGFQQRRVDRHEHLLWHLATTLTTICEPVGRADSEAGSRSDHEDAVEAGHGFNHCWHLLKGAVALLLLYRHLRQDQREGPRPCGPVPSYSDRVGWHATALRYQEAPMLRLHARTSCDGRHRKDRESGQQPDRRPYGRGHPFPK